MHKALHQQEPDGGSNKHSENEQNDNRWCETQHGNQSRVRDELGEPSPQGDLTRDGRDEHEGKQTKAQGRMLATWKASASFVRVMICFHFSRHHEELLSRISVLFVIPSAVEESLTILAEN